MALFADKAKDASLQVFTDDVDEIHITSQEPTTFTEATSTFTLGNKTGPTVGPPGDALPDGRKVTVGSFSDGNVTATGNVTHYALVDTVNSVLLGVGAVAAAPVAVSVGNNWSFDAFDVRLPDAA